VKTPFILALILASLWSLTGQAYSADDTAGNSNLITDTAKIDVIKELTDTFTPKLRELGEGNASQSTIKFIVPFVDSPLAKNTSLVISSRTNIATEFKYSRTTKSNDEWEVNEDVEIKISDENIEAKVVRSYELYPKLGIRLNESSQAKFLTYTEVLAIFNALKNQTALESACKKFGMDKKLDDEYAECVEVVSARLGLKTDD
jgi:hypothetical protein